MYTPIIYKFLIKKHIKVSMVPIAVN